MQIVKELYSELEKIGKSDKSTKDKTKAAKELIESKVGSLDELKKKGAEAAGQAGDKATETVQSYAAAIPGLEGLSKVCVRGELPARPLIALTEAWRSRRSSAVRT